MTPRGGYASTFQIIYPSGQRFTQRGILGTLTVPDYPVVYPAIDPGAPGEIIVLDPRAVIRDAEGDLVFQGCSTEELEAAPAQTSIKQKDAMKTNVRIHKNDTGLVVALSTNATDEWEFLGDLTDVLLAELRALVLREAAVDKFVAGGVDMFGITLSRALPHILELCCKLRGYKADVVEHRILLAGHVVPTDIVSAYQNPLEQSVAEEG